MAGESWKSQTWWNLPVYTGDVSGVCSALYELGGMVVMHDPSGCNSTYNTHDEIRWVSMESLIFLSGLTQLDAITGNDQRLIDDIVSAANTFHPAFIASANSPNEKASGSISAWGSGMSETRAFGNFPPMRSRVATSGRMIADAWRSAACSR